MTTLVLVLALLPLMLLQLWYLGQVMLLRGDNPSSSANIQRALEQGPVKQYWQDYDDISDALIRAVVVAEDSNFVRHWGFDVRGIRHAIRVNREAGRAVAGGSTLTQQLAKNLFLSNERSYFRKAQEGMIAIMLEATLSKERILELYLNIAQWGHQIYGAEAAARHHFNTSAAELTPQQASQLAAMLPRPNVYHFQGPTDFLRQRGETLQAQLHLAIIPAPGNPVEQQQSDSQRQPVSE